MRKVLFFLCLVGLSACSLLDKEPQIQVSDEKAITDVQSANAALIGLYNQVQELYNGRIQRLADVSGTTAQSIGTNLAYRQIDTYSVTSNNSALLDIWTIIYKGVNIANNILTTVPEIQSSNEEKNHLLGQAYFVRGLLFFEAVRIWGGVPNVAGTNGIPLPKEPSRSVSFQERASLEASYAQVEADLLEASKLLTDNSPMGQANKITANALLSRLYLYLKRYSEVERFANAVIGNPRNALVFPLTDVFNNKNTPESIFEIQFNSIDPSDISFFYSPKSTGGNGEIAAHTEFYNQIDRNDERSRLFVRSNDTGLWFSTKYNRQANSNNTHIIRLAEIYLNRAEARAYSNNFSGARADLNAVRARANAIADNTANSIEQLIVAIEKERRLELCFEGFEWFDLVRTGRAISVLNTVARFNAEPARLIDRNRLVFPIPFEEINANPKMNQNQGY
ncbi:MAG: RagB/SusD family nutrient uptake outer membrane protein [Thermoflexibacter sp.]|jgi:hypothetical protein|nr:RagB/SusD family nutrient uptake outer membrane protein [Thermoflexibacter sp.]